MGAISYTSDCTADCTHSNFDDREMKLLSQTTIFNQKCLLLANLRYFYQESLIQAFTASSKLIALKTSAPRKHSVRISSSQLNYKPQVVTIFRNLNKGDFVANCQILTTLKTKVSKPIALLVMK